MVLSFAAVAAVVGPFVTAKAAEVNYKQMGGKAKASLTKFFSSKFEEYVTQTYNRCLKVKTLISADTAVNIFDVYEPQTIVGSADFTGNISSGAGIDAKAFLMKLQSYNRLVLSATAGSGKSMMMRFFAVSCIREKRPFVPIFIELRSLNYSEEPDLLDALSKHIENYHSKFSAEELRDCLKSGHFALFLDGFDEIKDSYKEKVAEQIRSISQRAPSCPIVVSSRPDDRFDGWTAFDRKYVAPLNKQQAICLIQKTAFSDEAKCALIDKIEQEIWETHSKYLSNPLLVSMVLLTFRESYDIPTKRHIFYEEAVAALYYRHDARKDYKRERYVGLDRREFERLFSVFCVRSYVDSVYTFSDSDLREYLSVAVQNAGLDVSVDKLVEEIVRNVCLLVQDGTKYSFIHRSFQEFFVARFIVEQSEEAIQRLILRVGADWSSTETIALSYGLNPQLIDKAVIIPLLSAILDNVDMTDSDSILRSFARCCVTLRLRSGVSGANKTEEKLLVAHLGREGYVPVNALKFYVVSKLLVLSDPKTSIFKWVQSFSVEASVKSRLLQCKDEPSKEYLMSEGFRAITKYTDKITDLYEAFGVTLKKLEQQVADRDEFLSDVGL